VTITNSLGIKIPGVAPAVFALESACDIEQAISQVLQPMHFSASLWTKGLNFSTFNVHAPVTGWHIRGGLLEDRLFWEHSPDATCGCFYPCQFTNFAFLYDSGPYFSMGFLTIGCVRIIKAGFAADRQSKKPSHTSILKF
jgi:hypothetical protein